MAGGGEEDEQHQLAEGLPSRDVSGGEDSEVLKCLVRCSESLQLSF